MTHNGSEIYTRYFLGDYEINIQNGATKYIHYIGSPTGLVAIVVRENGNDNYKYVYTDHLGSILAVTDANGSVEARQSFDAWGRRRDINSWTPMAPTASTGLPDWLYRGYTGHEHLDQFGIINMNARLYDPVLGRMISPDNFVNGAFGTQGYNRYSYANNNPLKYIDPDGNEPITFAVAAVALVKAFFFAAVIDATIQIFQNEGLVGFDWGRAGLAGLRGAVSGGLSLGIGSLIQSAAITGADQMIAGAMLHGSSGVLQDIIFGDGDPGSGFVSGAIGSIVGHYGVQLKLTNSLVGSYVVGGTASALTSVITGGDPFKQFVIGGSVAAFNHASHQDAGDEESVNPQTGEYPEMLPTQMTFALFDLFGSGMRSAGNGIASGWKWSLRALRNWRLAKGGYSSFTAFKRAYGAAGKGKAWHHIVEQHADNVAEFGTEAIHNPRNLVALEDGAGLIHRQITGYYNSIQPFTNGTTVRNWIKTQGYSQQYDFGISVMRKFGWTP